MLIAIIVLTLIDLAATYYGLSAGYIHEVGLLAFWLINSLGVLAGLVMVALVTVVCITILGLLWKHRLVRICFVGLITIKSFVVLMHIDWILRAVL